ncbi:MAG: BofC C-terminal domain-containing protein [Oscillospiraceae bacterium]|nr:BofC C-terminal domain-containing protein [Oscillospiraceae bacterium]
MTIKSHKILVAILAAAAIAAVAVAIVCLVYVKTPQENQGAAAVPDAQSHGNQIYSTANSAVSQENPEILPPVSPSESHSDSNSSEMSKKDAYVVKIQNGKICVFQGTSDSPIQTLDVEIQSLPAGDRTALETGISVTGKDQLRRVLEDYQS